MAEIFNEQPGAGFNPAPRTDEQNAALINAIKAQSGAFGKNKSNFGLTAGLRSAFDLEGPESLGIMAQIPSLVNSSGDRSAFPRSSAIKALNLDPETERMYLEKTEGSESLTVPSMFENMSFGPEGNFLGGLELGGGNLTSPSGIEFERVSGGNDNLETIMAELEAARREVKDSGVLPRFDQEVIEGSGKGLSTKNIEKVLEAEAAEIDALLGNNPVFDNPMGDIESLIEQAKSAEQSLKEEERLGIDPPKAPTIASMDEDNRTGAAAQEKNQKDQAEDRSEKAFIAGMDDFILAARGENPKGPEKKTIEQYKQEFSDATGIDVSGKVDKKSALMAFGLALMKNKGRDILTEFGEAGEAAMPELAAARKEAKQAGLSAGKFALEMQSSDESKRKTAAEKAMNRTQYYVMPKGEGVGGFIKNMDKAKSQRLNIFELNALTTNPEFDENFEVISASNYTAIATKAMESPEAVENFASTKTKQALFSGDKIDPMFILDVFDINPNIENGPDYGKISGGSKAHEPVYRALSSSLKALNRADDKLAGAVALAEGGAANTTNQLVSWFKGVGSQLGVGDVEGNSPSEQLGFYLKSLKVENAAAILGEAGKTLSDSDRQLVEEIISSLSTLPFTGDNPELIVAKLKEFRIKVIEKKRNDIKEAYRNLDGFARQDTSALWSDGQWSEDDDAEYKRLVKKYKNKED